jgi:hypothetical protein
MQVIAVMCAALVGEKQGTERQVKDVPSYQSTVSLWTDSWACLESRTGSASPQAPKRDVHIAQFRSFPHFAACERRDRVRVDEKSTAVVYRKPWETP